MSVDVSLNVPQISRSTFKSKCWYKNVTLQVERVPKVFVIRVLNLFVCHLKVIDLRVHELFEKQKYLFES